MPETRSRSVTLIPGQDGSVGERDPDRGLSRVWGYVCGAGPVDSESVRASDGIVRIAVGPVLALLL